MTVEYKYIEDQQPVSAEHKKRGHRDRRDCFVGRSRSPETRFLTNELHADEALKKDYVFAILAGQSYEITVVSLGLH